VVPMGTISQGNIKGVPLPHPLFRIGMLRVSGLKIIKSPALSQTRSALSSSWGLGGGGGRGRGWAGVLAPLFAK